MALPLPKGDEWPNEVPSNPDGTINIADLENVDETAH